MDKDIKIVIKDGKRYVDNGGKLTPIAEAERDPITGKIIRFTGDSEHLNEWLEDEEDLYD